MEVGGGQGGRRETRREKRNEATSMCNDKMKLYSVSFLLTDSSVCKSGHPSPCQEGKEG